MANLHWPFLPCRLQCSAQLRLLPDIFHAKLACEIREICDGNAGTYKGVDSPCSLFARYMLSGMLEVRPFGRGPLRRFMIFGAPTFLFGKNLPKTLYTWSPDAIGIEHSWGGAIYIAKGFEFRVTQHFLFDRLGARNTNLGPADLGNNGPWGRYMTVGVRKSFGTRRW